MIVSPVSRLLAVADVPRSVAWYRDVLGFEPLPPRQDPGAKADADVVCGQARLQLLAADSAPDSTGVERPRGHAVLFLEVDDLATLHAAVIARGGAASGIEKANGIKMRVFQVADPDGHVLWFAQSFQEPDRPRDPARQLRQALPVLPAADVAAAVRHYVDALGFHVNYAQDDLGVMSRDDITVLLLPRSDRHPFGACEFYITDADALHAELTRRGARVQGRPVSQPWGLRQFTVLDLDGNELVFAQTFE